MNTKNLICDAIIATAAIGIWAIAIGLMVMHWWPL